MRVDYLGNCHEPRWVRAFNFSAAQPTLLELVFYGYPPVSYLEYSTFTQVWTLIWQVLSLLTTFTEPDSDGQQDTPGIRL